MAWFTKLPRQRAGAPITARSLNRVAEATEWSTRIRADAPLSIVTTAFGPMLRRMAQVLEVYIAITTSTITARSGNVPGSGTAKLQTWNGTVMADLPGPINVTAYSFSGAAGGIAAGKYCVILRIAGSFWVLMAEC